MNELSLVFLEDFGVCLQPPPTGEQAQPTPGPLSGFTTFTRGQVHSFLAGLFSQKAGGKQF